MLLVRITHIFLYFVLAFYHCLGQRFDILFSLFFLVHYFFRALVFVWQGTWSNRCWILGALVPGFLPSLFMDFLTTHWWTSSSLERLISFQILLAIWLRHRTYSLIAIHLIGSIARTLALIMLQMRLSKSVLS